MSIELFFVLIYTIIDGFSLGIFYMLLIKFSKTFSAAFLSCFILILFSLYICFNFIFDFFPFSLFDLIILFKFGFCLRYYLL